jgi:zinc transport system substrate-binding protein
MRYIISLGMASLLASAAQAEVPRVVTDIPPVHSLVAQVMGDLGTPELLLSRGADEHDFQLRPSQAAALNEAGVVFWIGPELTPWLERGLEGVPDTVAQVALLDAAGVVTQEYAEEAGHEHAEEGHDHAEEGHDHAAEGEAHAEEGHDHAKDEHAAGEEGHDHGHDHSGVDPHAWLSPENATVWVGVIAAELSRLDPDNAATYAANAEAAVQAITAADEAARAALEPVAGQPIVLFHDAFGYYAAHYGLNVAGTIAEGDAAAPGAARIAELQEVVKSGGAVCMFPEVQHDPALVEQIAEGSSARIGGELDPVGSSFDPGPDMYAALITGIATTIATCLTES